MYKDLICLELNIATPKGFYGINVGGSNLALKKIIVHNSVIDSGYHEAVCVIHVQNNGFFVKKNNKKNY